MANELKLVGYTPSQTVTVQLLDETLTPVGSAISTTEPVSGMYMGSVPGGTAAGSYYVAFYNGTSIVADGELEWDGTAEVDPDTGSTVVQVGSPGSLRLKTDSSPTIRVTSPEEKTLKVGT